MRVTFENASVHECTRVAFVSVTAYIFLIGIRNDSSGEFPLHTCGESTAATASQTGIQNCLDNIFRLHFVYYFCKSFIAVSCDIFVNIFGIDDTAVSQSNTVLLLVETCFVQGLDSLVSYCFIIEQFLDRIAFDQMFFHNLRHMLCLDSGIERAFRIDNHNRAKGTQTETAGLDNLNFFLQTIGDKFLFQSIGNCHRTGRGTACTAADEDMFFIFAFCFGRTLVTEFEFRMHGFTNLLNFLQRLHVFIPPCM